ncbi:MAG TPA: CDGSH iron-sulfur domain-containing protein [Nitrosopumilaceae archaeon]|nr:CDGSH iron-sulfur domain-containing protein [Nitrosopumilaceae archaeon]HXV38121.1 CDGSH iron-sulfur domain-containing protein [Nitrosopumilaceae archaeon]
MTKIVIKAVENGPNLVTIDSETKAALCRCGASNKKPHCDGTHSKIGFKAPASEVSIS